MQCICGCSLWGNKLSFRLFYRCHEYSYQSFILSWNWQIYCASNKSFIYRLWTESGWFHPHITPLCDWMKTSRKSVRVCDRIRVSLCSKLNSYKWSTPHMVTAWTLIMRSHCDACWYWQSCVCMFTWVWNHRELEGCMCNIYIKCM